MKCILYLWMAAACCICLPGFLDPARAQDLAVEWVTAAPEEGQAGDTVTLQGLILNHGPGMALAVQYRWVISADDQITQDDMALGSDEVLYEVLYAAGGAVVTRTVTAPPFPDPIAPAYFGLIVDPYEFAFDDNRGNNTGSAPFTFTADPPHGFYDTAGDNDLDAVHLSAAISGGNLNVAVTFAQPPAGMISALMGIDLDQDPATTGNNTTLPGAEAMVSLIYQTYDSVVTLENDAGTHTLADAVLDGNTLTYAVPLSLLYGDMSMDLFWAVDSAAGASADFDRLPDVGAFATDTETIVVRRPGDPTIQVSVPDPAAAPGDPEFPDIRQLDAQVVGDQLHLTLTYAHGVDVMQLPALGDGLFVWVDMDTDRRLATGFANTGQTPPSLGIDHQLRLQLDDLAGIVPELRKDVDGDGEPETFPMGLPFNDMFMRLSGNEILLRVPLVYLGDGDGSGALAVTSLDTREILTGVIDRLPDSGAWDLQNDVLLPGQTCIGASREVFDPADDSIGAFGYDNDELVHASLCTGDRAFLFSVDYKSYLLSNDGATLVFLDTDRNPATGWATDNLAGDTTIGADYVLRTYWDTNELKQMTHLYRTQPPESLETVHQFATPTQANRIYLTLPLESIGSPAGLVDILVRTASWGGGGSGLLLPNDDLPNSGVATLAALPGPFPGDLDFDGDVDGRDLAALAGGLWALDPSIFAMDFGKAEGG